MNFLGQWMCKIRKLYQNNDIQCTMFELTNYLFYMFETNYIGLGHNLGQIVHKHLLSCGHFSFFVASGYTVKN